MTTPKDYRVAHVPAEFTPGGSPGDLRFNVRLAANPVAYWRGRASLAYCLKADRTPMGGLAPGETARGVLVGLWTGKDGDGLNRVQLPDGEIYLFDDGLFGFAGDIR